MGVVSEPDIELGVPRDLGDGITSIAVPFPDNPLGYTLVYVLDSDSGPVLIDTGWNDPESWRGLNDGLHAMGLSVDRVYGVVITHHHPDHSGLNHLVQQNSSAWIAMHPADADQVRKFADAVRDGGSLDGWEAGGLERAGASAAEVEEFAAHSRGMRPPSVPDREPVDGELIDLPGRKLRALWTPGHTPGHLCFVLEDAGKDGTGRLFTGDHLLPRITPHVGLYPYDTPDADPLTDFLASQTRLTELGIDDALPAHRREFHGVTERAEYIIAHHEERLEELRALLSDDPITLWDATSRLHWKRPWDQMPVFQRRMAAGEAAAHLRTLESRGQARRTPDDPTLTYVTT